MNDDPATEILDATYQALCDHGYADLTLQDIAAEADVSKASIHYHYGSKENLFTEFLGYLYSRYTAHLEPDAETPRRRLFELLETVLADETTPDRPFRTAMLEVKAQAPYDDAIRDRLAEFDEYLYEQFRETIAAGIDEGTVDDRVDPEVAAQFLTTAVTGARTRQVSVDRSPDCLRESIERYVRSHLLAGERPGVAQ